MPLWLLFVSAFLLLAAAAVGTVGYFTTQVLGGLLSGQAYIDAAFQAGIVALFLLAAIAVLFLFVARLTIVPVNRLTAAMRAFSERSERRAIIVSRMTPKEIQELIRSFVALMGSVETSRKRDAEVSRVKSDFISTAAHQLRTPLTGIRWSLEALSQGTLTEEQKSLVASANDKIHDLVAIVSTLFDISSIESGKYHYTFTSVDMRALLEEVANDFKPLADQRQVQVVFQAGDALPSAHADRDRIKWVLNNLVENGIRYTPAGGSVSIIAEAVSGRILIRVRDTGIGISDQDRTNIFERFYRAPNAIAKENAGNGLGLYIARTIAKDHGGDLDFESNTHGPGTTFILTLPADGMPSR